MCNLLAERRPTSWKTIPNHSKFSIPRNKTNLYLIEEVAKDMP